MTRPGKDPPPRHAEGGPEHTRRSDEGEAGETPGGADILADLSILEADLGEDVGGSEPGLVVEIALDETEAKQKTPADAAPDAVESPPASPTEPPPSTDPPTLESAGEVVLETAPTVTDEPDPTPPPTPIPVPVTDGDGELPEEDTSEVVRAATEAPRDPRFDDPKQLRSMLRRARRKLKEADGQSDRLRRMAAQEAIERTRLTIALKEATDKTHHAERELIELRREHRDTTRDLERWRDATQQIKKDLESMRDRRRKEREEAQQTSLATVIQELLPVFDHMELAITHAGTHPGRIVDGVKMVMDQLDKTFVRLGVERVEAKKGQPFVPERHEAVMHVDKTELDHGAIVELLRPGYMLNGKLLRAARVSVASRGSLPDAPPPPPLPEAPAPPAAPIAEESSDVELLFEPPPDLKADG